MQYDNYAIHTFRILTMQYDNYAIHTFRILRTSHRCSHIITKQKHTRMRALTNTYTDARAPTQAHTHADAEFGITLADKQ